MPYSITCNNVLPNFEANQNYKEVSDPSILVRFNLDNNCNEYIIAWTTTPWTLPSNLGLCVNKNKIYVQFEWDGCL